MPEQNPNVLFIMADDASPITGAYGNQVIQTPRMDELSQRGTTFDHAFCTSPSCAVSRAAILTGQHSHTHGQYGHCHGRHTFRTHEWMLSTPSLLNDAGYFTGLIGKAHVAPDSVYPFQTRIGGGDLRSPDITAKYLRQCIDQAGDRPFFCHLALADPHRALDQTRFDNSQSHAGEQVKTYRPEDVEVPNFLPDIPEVRAELAEYYRALSRYDQCIGAAVDALQASGKADNTLIVVTSDHGMPFPGAKGSSFEGGHHCPLIVVNPNQSRGGIHNNALVNWTCFLPTIMDWCGLQPPEDLPERSLLPILDQAEPEGWDQTFYSHCFHEVTNYYPYRVLRGRRYKYVLNLASELPTPLPSDLYRSYTWQAVLEKDITMLGQRPREHFLHQPHEALYDLEQDPAETHNLIDAPGMAEIVEPMRQQLYEFRRQTQDPWLELSYQRNEAPDPKTA